VKFHGPLRDVEFRGNFLVRTALKDAIQNFLLAAANLNPRPECSTSGQELLSALRSGFQEGFTGNDHQFVIFRRLPSHQAVDGEQSGNFFNRHASVGFRFDAETNRARGPFAQDKTLHDNRWTLIVGFNGLLSSAYQG